jgi:hypothetical protein
MEQWPGLNVPIAPSFLTQVPCSHLVLSNTNNVKEFALLQDKACADAVTLSSLHLQQPFTGGKKSEAREIQWLFDQVA